MSSLNPTSLYLEFSQSYTDLGVIGRVGEINSRKVVIDCEDILLEFPGAQIICVCRRYVDEYPYTIELSSDGTRRFFTLSDRETSSACRLTLEFRALLDGRVYKSSIVVAKILPSISMVDTIGDPYKDTLDRLENMISTATDLIKNINNMIETGELKGDKGDSGSDASVTPESIRDALGYSPVCINDDVESEDSTWSSKKIVDYIRVALDEIRS